MKKLSVFLVIIFVSGCAQMIPARSTEIEVGKYKLEASGNAFASLKSLREKIDQKAIKLCGKDNYIYEDTNDISNQHSAAYSNGVDVGASYTVVTRVVTCKK